LKYLEKKEKEEPKEEESLVVNIETPHIDHSELMAKCSEAM
jgi:hypothetical protein